MKKLGHSYMGYGVGGLVKYLLGLMQAQVPIYVWENILGGSDRRTRGVFRMVAELEVNL